MKYQRGALYELMIFMLAPVYAYTGYYIGSTWGFGWIGAIAGFCIGMPILSKPVFSKVIKYCCECSTINTGRLPLVHEHEFYLARYV